MFITVLPHIQLHAGIGRWTPGVYRHAGISEECICILRPKVLNRNQTDICKNINTAYPRFWGIECAKRFCLQNRDSLKPGDTLICE